VSATLSLRREGTIGFELRRGTFEVLVDGQPAGTLEYGDKIEIPVPPGHHVLRLRAKRYSSRDHGFDATDGEVIALRCHAPMVWPRWLISWAMPNLGISVWHD
jgi:hypothetical protein